MSAPILVAGVGNIFFGDDGFGVEVARQLLEDPLPPQVDVEDFGIRGMHLALRLQDPFRLVIIVDLASARGTPGSLYVVEPGVDRELASERADAHGMDIPTVLSAASAMGAVLPPVRIVGCEPGSTGEGIGLSPAVAAAVPCAQRLVLEIVERELSGRPGRAPPSAGGTGHDLDETRFA